MQANDYLMSNLIIEADGDNAARAQTYGTVFQAAPDLPLQPIIAVTYHDRFARTEGAWHFSARRLQVNLMGKLNAHLLQTI